jgi:hypothetical protein
MKLGNRGIAHLADGLVFQQYTLKRNRALAIYDLVMMASGLLVQDMYAGPVPMQPKRKYCVRALNIKLTTRLLLYYRLYFVFATQRVDGDLFIQVADEGIQGTI